MVKESEIEQVVIDTIAGPLSISGDGDFIRAIEFADTRDIKYSDYEPESSVVKETVEQLQAYFSGRLFSFDVPLRPVGTDFQKRVWHVIADIEYGHVITYGDIASQLGNIRLSRAVGQAANRNPIPIVVPCHRVVGANGALVGFAPGVALKKVLLDHEQRFRKA